MENDQRLTPLPGGFAIQSSAVAEAPSPSYSPSYDDSLENKRSIRQYFNIVYKRLPIIMALTILVTAAAAFYSIRQPSIYQASTQMIIEPPKPQVTKKDAININFGGDANYYNTQLQLLKNVGLMKRVVIATGLYKEQNLFENQSQGVVASIRSLFSGGKKSSTPDNTLPVLSTQSNGEKPVDVQLTPEENARAEQYAGTLVGRLDVTPVERTNIVNITVTNENPVLAARVADGVANLFKKEDEDRSMEGARTAYENLKTSIDELKANIRRDEDEQIAEMERHNLGTTDKASELRAGDLSALQAQLRQSQDEVAKLQARYSTALAANRTNDIFAVMGENQALIAARTENNKRESELEKRIEELEKKINEANEKKKELLAKYTEEHRDVIAITERIKELESQKIKMEGDVRQKVKSDNDKLVNKTAREVLTGLSSALNAAQQRERSAQQAFDQAVAKANGDGINETKLVTLNRQIKSNRDLLDIYMQRIKEQELGLSTDQPKNIQINSSAVVPTGPIGPNRPRNILVAFLVSLAAGIGLAFLMDYLDDSVRTSDDVSRHLGLPTLALIPHSQNDKRKLLAAGKGGGASNVAGSALIMLDERNSPMAEAYRHLRTSLLFSSAGKPPQVILVTSSQPSEGKTTTAINTAITLAQSDADVVIIDCDLRRPRLHNHFGLENTHGLTNYLSGDRSTEHMLRECDGLPKLKVITSGPIPPNPAELLSSNEMRNLLQFLKGRFKHIVIDSPPAISFTDASILSTLADGVVLVAMANRSSIHLMRQFKQRTSNIGARIYGVVLNGIKSGSMEYYYYGSGYYKYYGYGYRPGDDSTPRLEDQLAGNDDEHETDA